MWKKEIAHCISCTEMLLLCTILNSTVTFFFSNEAFMKNEWGGEGDFYGDIRLN